MHPSKWLHIHTATASADMDIYIPDCLNQFCHCHTGISGLEFLISLKPKDKLQFFLLRTVVQESIVPYFLKARRKHMQKKKANKFFVLKCNGSLRLSGTFPSGRKGSGCFIHGLDTTVGDGNLMRVTPQIFDGVTKTVKSLFDIRAPVLFVKLVLEFFPFIGITQSLAGCRKIKFPGFVIPIQECHILSFKLITEFEYRDKKRSFGFLDFAIPGKSAARNNAVHVYMITKLLVPCMKHLNDSGCSTERFFISSELQQGLS